MQAIEFNATPHSGMLLIPEMYRQQWEGLSVRVILLPANEATPATPKPKHCWNACAPSKKSTQPPTCPKTTLLLWNSIRKNLPKNSSGKMSNGDCMASTDPVIQRVL